MKVESLSKAFKRIFTSKHFWANALGLFVCLVVGFIAKFGLEAFNSKKLLIGLFLMNISLTLFCVLSVVVYELFYLKAFKLQGKYFLIERYIWALALPYALAFMLQMAIGMGDYVPFTVIYSFVLSAALSVVAFTKGQSGRILVWVSAPFTFGYFFSFGLSFLLWMAYSAKFIKML